MAVGQDWQGDVRVILFVRLREGVRLDDALRDRIKKTIRDNTTPRHVPAKIIACRTSRAPSAARSPNSRCAT